MATPRMSMLPMISTEFLSAPRTNMAVCWSVQLPLSKATDAVQQSLIALARQSAKQVAFRVGTAQWRRPQVRVRRGGPA